MRHNKRFLKVLFALVMVFTMLFTSFAVWAQDSGAAAYQDVVVLSTTDMHGKCWDTNVLTGDPETHNMLRVSTAVSHIREEYGPENVILLDNGDLFQGTAVSEMLLRKPELASSGEPLPMALCLKEIGYDAFVLGNHEFNYNWNVMRQAYDYLEENGISVLAANIYYDGTDGVHEAGEQVFTPYIVREILVDGHPHKIGILGFENVDITRWDLAVNYPGMIFVSPDNENFSISREAEKYIPKMREEGCEFIILSYHGGIGNTDQELKFGVNTESQGLRLIEETEGLGLVILGHDHSGNYSGLSYIDKSGASVMVVNGGGQELTKTVIRFSEDADGRLVWDLQESGNLKLDNYDVDEDLQEKIRPYADQVSIEIEKPIGYAAGDWDESNSYYLSQTDTIDLVHLAQMQISSGFLKEKYGENGEELPAEYGLDHLDVDLSMSTALTKDNYVVKPGGISVKDVYRLYRFSNALLILPLSGREIVSIMEENAAKHVTARVIDGKVYYYTNSDSNTNILFGGMNFTYDMAKPEGERVKIESFSNGRPFEEDQIYLAAVNNYLLGNDRCGLRDYGAEDAIWNQTVEHDEEDISDIIIQYIEECCEDGGELTPDAVTWKWSVEYSADPADLPAWDGDIAATYTAYPEEGREYIIYHEASGNTFADIDVNGGLESVACEAYTDTLIAPLDEKVLRFTVKNAGDDKLFIQTPDGRYLVCNHEGGLLLTDEPPGDDPNTKEELYMWKLHSAEGGWNLDNAGVSNEQFPQAIEFYSGHFSMYGRNETGIYIFNFYEVSQ